MEITMDIVTPGKRIFDIRPCPECGCIKIYPRIEHTDDDGVWLVAGYLQCAQCQSFTSSIDLMADSPDALFSEWNTFIENIIALWQHGKLYHTHDFDAGKYGKKEEQ